MTGHRFSNSARLRQQVLELAGQPTVKTSTGAEARTTAFHGWDWLLGRRQLMVIATKQPERKGTKPETLLRYARIVLHQQAQILRRLFWWAFLLSFTVGIVAGAVGAAVLLNK